MTESVTRTLASLTKNAMTPYFVETAADVVPLLHTLLHENDLIAVGGSMTLDECHILEHLRCGKYRFLDRYTKGLTPEETGSIYRQAFGADVYLTSSNAITEDGALVNMDGNANRVAAMAYGPQRVIVIAGVNKIVPDEPAARKRIAEIAAPKNATRLTRKTPCVATGTCQDCSSPDRICCTYMVQRQQRTPGRICVILVNEALGY